MSFNFCLFRLCLRPVVHRPLSLLAIVVHPLRVVALSAACSPCVIGYQPLAQQPTTSSLRPPPPAALFSCSPRRHPPDLATANRRCRLTAPILAFLCLPPAVLLAVARLLPASIVAVRARKGRGGMPPARSLFRRSDRRKPAVVSAVVVAPHPDVVFVIVNAAMIVTPPPPPRRGGSNDWCVGSSCWCRTIYPPPRPRR
jgi:hypothetical protein